MRQKQKAIIKAFSSFCPNRMGQKPHLNRAEKILIVII